MYLLYIIFYNFIRLRQLILTLATPAILVNGVAIREKATLTSVYQKLITNQCCKMGGSPCMDHTSSLLLRKVEVHVHVP